MKWSTSAITFAREEHVPYHSRKRSRKDTVPPEEREFIAWDGEGVNIDGPNRPQSYVLFGCSAEDFEPLISKVHLHTFTILDYIVEVGKAHPSAFHVGFAFGYDSNMIVRSLSLPALQRLHKEGELTLRRKNGVRYYVTFLPKKWFSVTRYDASYDRKTNPTAKTHVKIFDLFSFFAKSFVRAYEELVGPAPDVVKAGKQERKNFDSHGAEYMEAYWRVEIVMLRELAEELRNRLYDADLRITQWHGPGALANYAMAKHGIDKAKAECPKPVREAAKYGYAGGRFEIFHLGRIASGKTIYSLDINSAYPYGIAQLPNLTTGTWSRVVGPIRRIAKFGIYHVRLLPNADTAFYNTAPGPLFHRDALGNISYPWVLEGWYWSPEVRNLFSLDSKRYEIIEGWEYRGWANSKPTTSVDVSGAATQYQQTIAEENTVRGAEPISMPFAWVKEMYEQRKELKAKGDVSQLALKLCMNSLYGKMAQRVGWNQELRLPPKWHQLEWAGWVTSLCRAMLWNVMARIPFQELIAVETDGLYTTMPPEQLSISNSTELGGWEIQEYEEIMYVQSGMAWLRKGSEWTCKRRGLDARTFALTDCNDYLHALAPQQIWAPYIGETTRFIGLGAALNGSAPPKTQHCVWRTSEREIRPGHNGKRVHLHTQCRACRDGLSAWDAPHDMSIRSLAYGPDQQMSKPHDIPWDGDEDASWRKREVLLGEAHSR